MYQIENIKTKEQMAAKLETNNNSDDILSVLREAFLMGKLQNIVGIPKVLWSGSEGHHDIMVLQLLGKDLGSYLRILKTMCLKTVVEIGIQSINIVRQFHEKNIIHRDLKPENMIMGRKGENHQVYIVDFGISKFYKNSKGQHIMPNTKKSFIGTTRYAPISAHQGYELSCKDDLESLGYVLIYLRKGRLPWQDLNISENNKTKRVGEVKMQTSLQKLCKGLPQQFIKYFQHIRALEFA